jgi:hypothetical protein
MNRLSKHQKNTKSIKFVKTEVENKLITQNKTEPITQPITEPITQPITEPITQPITEPFTEFTTELITEPFTEFTNEPITEFTNFEITQIPEKKLNLLIVGEKNEFVLEYLQNNFNLNLIFKNEITPEIFHEFKNKNFKILKITESHFIEPSIYIFDGHIITNFSNYMSLQEQLQKLFL